MPSHRRHTLGGNGNFSRATEHSLSADELSVALPLRSLGCSPRCRNWMAFWCAQNTHLCVVAAKPFVLSVYIAKSLRTSCTYQHSILRERLYLGPLPASLTVAGTVCTLQRHFAACYF